MCPFCEKIDKSRVMFETVNWIAFYDAYPVSPGHTLLVPKEHVETYFGLSDMMKEQMHYAVERIKGVLDAQFHPDGYNIGFNCGEASGQTVMHFHLHIIPRYKGDVENPRGGVRGVIPKMQDYGD